MPKCSHSFIPKIILITFCIFCISGTVLGIGDIAVNRTDKVPTLVELIIFKSERQSGLINKLINKTVSARNKCWENNKTVIGSRKAGEVGEAGTSLEL